MKTKAGILAGILLGLGSIASAKTIPIANFFTHASFVQPKLSPSGRYMALLDTDEKHPDRNFLEIVDTQRMTAINSFLLAPGVSFRHLYWADNKRLIYTTNRHIGGYARPFPSGKIFLVKVHSGSVHLLQANTSRRTYTGFRVIDAAPADPKHIITASYARHHNPAAYVVAIRGRRGSLEINKTRGISTKIHRIAGSPFQNGDLMADNAGRVRLATGYDEKSGKPEWAYRNPGALQWKKLPTALISPVLGAKPIGFTPDNKHIYLLAYARTGTLGLYRYNPMNGKKKLIYADQHNDIDATDFFDGLMYGPKGDKLAALTQMPGRPQLIMLNKKSLAGKVLSAFSASFPGELTRLVSWNRDGSKAILSVTSGHDPGQYLLADTHTLKAKIFAQRNPKIDPRDMASVKPIKFKARDGLTIHGYLTTPKGAKAHNPPMIVVVHGGPYGVRDQWRFNPVVQLFANRGYAVLQVNYRGSTGYGKRYAEAGFRHWGTTMQYDIIDGTRWALKRGIADPKRVCIYGASYGGYAALMSSELAPKLYKCTIGYDGVYDLSLMFHSGDVPELSFGRRYLHAVLGDNPKRLREQSPDHHVNRLKGGLFLVQGGQDKRAPPAQVQALKTALDRAGKHYKYLYKSNEGHGFYRVKDKRELYGEVLAFIKHYIGG